MTTLTITIEPEINWKQLCAVIVALRAGVPADRQMLWESTVERPEEKKEVPE